MSNEVMTKESPQIKSLFTFIEKISATVDEICEDYEPCLNGERYLTDWEVSNILKISRRTLQEYRNERKITYILLGGKVIYKESDIQKLLKKHLHPAMQIKEI